MKKHILSLLLLLVFSIQGIMAKDYAYIYIEGDKQVPFYVKLEGQMMPRLGKNYCILANMDAGVSNVEILFQQNQFPPQKFVIKVPEGGSRGFLLKQVNERQYALYDLQQGFYLMSGNSADDDKLLPVTVVESTNTSNTIVQNQAIPPQADLPAFVPGAQSAEKKTKKDEHPVIANPQENRTFIKDMELNTDEGATPAISKRKKNKTRVTDSTTNHIAAVDADEFEDAKKDGAETLVAQGIPNSDCKTAMSNDAFEDFATKILDQTTDDDKLKILAKNKDKNCFTTEQVRIIANNFETQSGRYEVTRMLFSRTSDQDNYPKLEALFKTNYLKDKFKEIMSSK